MTQSSSGWRLRLDKLKEASLSMKINELHCRVIELQDKTQDQLELMGVFARHIEDLADELSNEEDS
jgi:hypothetical protein